MFGIPVIEIAISLVFAFVLLSILCTIINEWLANLLSLRSRNLRGCLNQLLADQDMTGLAKDVWNHPLIKNSSESRIGPAYIASNTFARVFIDILDQKSGMAVKVAKNKAEIETALDKANLPEDMKKVMKGLIDDADTSIKDLRNNLQIWFDNSMDRFSGIYKRGLQTISFIVALILAISLNVDTIEISRVLWKNPVLRTQIADEVAVAVEMCKDKNSLEECPTLKGVDNVRTQLEKFPVGWMGGNKVPSGIGAWVFKIVGLILTALAASLGAPFWFDILNKLNSLRSTGTKPKATN